MTLPESIPVPAIAAEQDSNVDELALPPQPPVSPLHLPVDDGPKAELFKRLAEVACEFDFFWSLRRIECATSGKPRIGESFRLEQDAVRFGQEPSLSFAPSTLAKFDPGAPGRNARLTVRFFGMWGPNGPLPLHLSEYARDRQRHDADPTLTRFMDIFHHRLLSLFYRAWACNQPVVSHDRAGKSGSSEAALSQNIADRFSVYLASTIGRGMPSMLGRDMVPDAAKLHYAGRLAAQTTNAEGLEAILSDYFGVPCWIEPFIGQWIEIPRENRCFLGRNRETGTLGETALAGSTTWDCQQKFRVHLGPMSFERFTNFLPDRPGYKQLKDWVRNYVGDALGWDARLSLERREVPQICLGRLGQLGWSTWALSGPAQHDGTDLLLNVQ